MYFGLRMPYTIYLASTQVLSFVNRLSAALADLYGTGYVPVYVEEPGVRFTLRKEVRYISPLARRRWYWFWRLCFRLVGLELRYRLSGCKTRFAEALFSFAVGKGGLIHVVYD